MKTVKQLSEEIGISKQALLKRIKKMTTDRQPFDSQLTTNDELVKENGKYYINSNLESILKELILKEKSIPTTDRQQTDNQSTTDRQQTDNQETIDKKVFDLLNSQIEFLKSQVESKDHQIQSLQKLLENQQVLNLQANNKILEIEENRTKKRFFSFNRNK